MSINDIAIVGAADERIIVVVVNIIDSVDGLNGAAADFVLDVEGGGADQTNRSGVSRAFGVDDQIIAVDGGAVEFAGGDVNCVVLAVVGYDVFVAVGAELKNFAARGADQRVITRAAVDGNVLCLIVD